MIAHDVAGRTVTMPVGIRDARCFVAAFTADVEAVSATIAHTGLTPLRVRPGLFDAGRTLCMLVFVDYVDGDLGPYNEFGVCFLVDDPGRPQPAGPLTALRSLITGDARALVHRLPVDGEFTLAAGRGIWGFPKTLADFDVDHDSTIKRGVVEQDGSTVIDLRVRPGVRVPDSAASSDVVLHAYSHLDGVTRMTNWRLRSTTGTRTRPGGATITLGTGPIADELRSLKLSRSALMASSVEHIEMTFEEPTVLREP